MLKGLTTFIADLTGGRKETTSFDDSDHRLAAAALLFHAVAIDGVIEPEERAKLKELIKARFDLDDTESDTLIEEGRQRDLEAVDLHGFTSVLNRSLDDDGKARVIEMLWEIVYVDGKVHEFEDNLVWRVAELLGVSTRDRVRLRQQVEAGRERDMS